MNRAMAILLVPLLLLWAGSLAAQDQQPDIEVHTLAEGVWVHTTYRRYDNGLIFPSHGLIVREGDELVLIDTAWGEQETRLLLDAIAIQVGLPVTRAVVTHFHGDRAQGTDLLEAEGIEVWAHPMTREISIAKDYAVPDLTFEGLDHPGDAVRFGTLEVFYPGPAHTRDNIMVWLPQQQLLFGGCAIRGAADDELGNVRDGDVAHWPTAMALTEARYGGAKIVVSSHAEPGGAGLIGHTEDLARRAAQTETEQR